MINIFYTFLRGITSYLLLLIITRIMGQKIISQMTFFDFAVAITLGSLAGSLGLGANSDSKNAVTVMITFALLGISADYLHIKSILIRKTVNLEPVILVQNGKINTNNMKKYRITINDLTSMLRQKNLFNIRDVEFAILENNGELSVLPKSQKQALTPSDLDISTPYRGLTTELIIDGNIMYENLKDVKLDELWLREQLQNKGITNIKEVFFAALDTSGNLYVSRGIKR